MATNKPISGFSTLPAAQLLGTDELIMVDVSDTSQAPTGSTKKVLVSSVLNNPNNGVVTGILVPILGTAGAGKIVKTAQNGMVFQSSGGALTDYAFLDSTGNQIAYLRASDSSLTVQNRIVAGLYQGGSGTPTGSKTAGTSTVTTFTLAAGSTNSAGNLGFTVTGTGSWTVRVTYNSSQYTLAPFVQLTAVTSNWGGLYPYVASYEDFFEISGNDFVSTGVYSINYQVMQ